MAAMTHCRRCGHSSMVRSYDGVICLLCGYEEVEQKHVPTSIQTLVETLRMQEPVKRGPKPIHRKSRLSA